MATIVSFINLKGGVGKTTNTIAIAEFLAEEFNKRVLVIDLDPQTNATISLISDFRWKELDKDGRTLYQLFKDVCENSQKFKIKEAIIPLVSNVAGGLRNLSLLPSSLGIIDLQEKISSHMVLDKVLKPVVSQYDYVLIDCPPSLGTITKNGIYISNYYVIPVIPDVLSTYGLQHILKRMESFNKEYLINIEAIGIIISKFRASSKFHNLKLRELIYKSDIRKPLAERFPEVFQTVIPESAKIAEIIDAKSGAFKTLRQKYGADMFEAYKQLTREFIEKCQKK